VANNPINWIDPSGLAPGDPYKSPDEAGEQAIRDINRKSIRQGAEYAGRICKNPDGTYTYTPPNKGTKDGSNIGPPCSKGAKNEGDYHTHGADDPGYDNENFSPADKEGIDGDMLPGFLGTPKGRIKKYTPDPTRTGHGKCTNVGTGAN
jgi:hypothetical protein